MNRCVTIWRKSVLRRIQWIFPIRIPSPEGLARRVSLLVCLSVRLSAPKFWALAPDLRRLELPGGKYFLGERCIKNFSFRGRWVWGRGLSHFSYRSKKEWFFASCETENYDHNMSIFSIAFWEFVLDFEAWRFANWFSRLLRILWLEFAFNPWSLSRQAPLLVCLSVCMSVCPHQIFELWRQIWGG